MIKNMIKYAILFIVALFLVCFVYLTTTSTGLNIIVDKLNRWQTSELHISQVTGALNGSIHIKRIDYHSSGTKIQINNINIDVQPLALFLAEFRVDHLHIGQIKFVAHNNSQQTSWQPIHWRLPLRIQLNDFTLQHLQLNKNDYQDVTLSSYVKNNYIQLRSFSLRQKKNTYWLKGYVDLQPIKLNLHLQIQQNQKVVLDTRLSGLGSWKKLNLHNTMRLPVKMDTALTVQSLFSKPTWVMTGNIDTSPLGSLNSTLDALKFTGPFSGSGNNGSVHFKANLHSNNSPGTLNLQLNSVDIKTEKINGLLSWQSLRWPLTGQTQIQSQQGKILLSGQLPHLLLNSQFMLVGKNIPQSHWQTQMSLTDKRLTLKQLHVDMLNGTLTGSGGINLSARHNFTLSLQGKQLNPGVKWFNWPGRINMSVQLKGNAQQQQLQLNTLSGTLRQQKLHGSLNLLFNKQHLRRLQTTLNIGQAHVNSNADIENNIQANWSISIPNLALLTPFASGEIESQGEMLGTEQRPRVNGNITAENLAYLQYQIGKLTSQFDLNIHSQAKSVLILQTNNVRNDQVYMPTLNINSSGNQTQQNTQLHFVYKGQTFRVHLHSQQHNNIWTVKIPLLTMDSADLGNWSLAKPSTLIISQHRFFLQDFAWQAYQQSIIANLDLRKNDQGQYIPRSSNIKVNNLTLHLLSLFLPNNISLQGHVNFSANIATKQNKQQAHIRLSTKNATIDYHDKHIHKKWFLKNVDYLGTLDPQGINSHFTLAVDNNDHLDFSLHVAKANNLVDLLNSENISSKLNAAFVNINFLNLFLPELKDMTGKLAINLTSRGSLYSPILHGHAELTNATANISSIGIQLKNINIKVKGGQQQLHWQAALNSGQGQLNAVGTTDYAHPKQTTINVTGKNIAVLRTNQYKVTASPKLTITTHPNHIKVVGDVAIPSANIRILTAANVSTLPTDVKIISSNTEQTRSKSMFDNIHSHINLSLGKNVTINAFKLKSQLQGNIVINDTTNSTSQTTGEIVLTQGSYQVFGQELSIKNGKLIYAGGPIDNPSLDIRASKAIRTFVNPTQDSLTNTNLNNTGSAAKGVNIPLQAKTITVGASVTNSLLDPSIALYSDQSDLTEADILSYLIFGFPMGQANNQQGEALWQAASLLSANSRDISGVMQQLKSRFALSSIGFESNSYLNANTNTVQQNTSLVLGKMLSPDLFIKYSIGLIDPINTLSAAYTIDQNWTAQTETNSLGNGVDLIYSWQNG